MFLDLIVVMLWIAMDVEGMVLWLKEHIVVVIKKLKFILHFVFDIFEVEVEVEDFNFMMLF